MSTLQQQKPVALDTTSPPWLAFSGLPSDGSVDGGVELEAFGRFMAATPREVAARQAVRRLVQQGVAAHVNSEATTKVVGLCAVGIDVYSSTLELEVDFPRQPSEPAPRVTQLEVLAEYLKIAGFTETTVATPPPVPSSDSAQDDAHANSSLTAPYLTAVAPFDEMRVKVTIVGDETAGEKKRRYHSLRVARVLRQYEGTDAVVRVVLCILERMKLIKPENGLLNPESVAVLCLAFLLARWSYLPAVNQASLSQFRKAEPLSGALLKDFFYYYSTFDFETTSIVLPDAGERIDPFPKKACPSKQITVYASSKSTYNLACATTKLCPILATLKYVTLAIGKWDLSPLLNRGKSLLFNIIAHRDLWGRYFLLRNLPVPDGFNSKKPFKAGDAGDKDKKQPPPAAVVLPSTPSAPPAAAKMASDESDEVDASGVGEA
ncbi:hypothetical protein DIPPA_15296 [Diplonema papillatum]|nr:hypothetical protein DIPPA_15296 [Diplonema papillatum]|eukprot:gene18989-29250_t